MSRRNKRVRRGRSAQLSASIPRPRWGEVAALVEDAYELGYEDGRLGENPVSQDPSSHWMWCDLAEHVEEVRQRVTDVASLLERIAESAVVDEVELLVAAVTDLVDHHYGLHQHAMSMQSIADQVDGPHAHQQRGDRDMTAAPIGGPAPTH